MFMKNTIEKKFHPKISGILQFVSDYEDFSKVDVGDCLGIFVHGRGNEFSAYFEGREEKKRNQIILLQQEEKINDGPRINEKRLKVVEYQLPLKGKIYLEHFERGKIKEYPVK